MMSDDQSSRTDNGAFCWAPWIIFKNRNSVCDCVFIDSFIPMYDWTSRNSVAIQKVSKSIFPSTAF